MILELAIFKNYIPLVTLDDVRIQLYLDDAKRVVTRDGFDESHVDFDELQKLAALALMQEDKVVGVKSASSVGNNPDGISSIGVSGINIGFQSPSMTSVIRTAQGKTGYYLDYENLRRKLHGFKGRVA